MWQPVEFRLTLHTEQGSFQFSFLVYASHPADVRVIGDVLSAVCRRTLG